jgi:hypothetical protein
MPRTDENGRQLKALLDYLLDGEIDAKDIYDALPPPAVRITGESKKTTIQTPKSFGASPTDSRSAIPTCRSDSA